MAQAKRLQLIISTMFRRNHSLLSEMNIQSEAMVYMIYQFKCFTAQLSHEWMNPATSMKNVNHVHYNNPVLFKCRKPFPQNQRIQMHRYAF